MKTAPQFSIRRLLIAVFTLMTSNCATVPRAHSLTERQLLTAALNAFMSEAPQSPAPMLWLTNEEDSECDRAGEAKPPPPDMSSNSSRDPLAFEVFSNHLVASQWAKLIEGHRHNYARELKPETHRALLIKPDTVSSAEDLCLLDEAKKRNADKVLVYQVLGASFHGVLVHFRLSNARTGLVEVSRTLLSNHQGVEDKSVR